MVSITVPSKISVRVTIRLGAWLLFPKLGMAGLNARDYLGENLEPC